MTLRLPTRNSDEPHNFGCATGRMRKNACPKSSSPPRDRIGKTAIEITPRHEANFAEEARDVGFDDLWFIGAQKSLAEPHEIFSAGSHARSTRGSSESATAFPKQCLRFHRHRDRMTARNPIRERAGGLPRLPRGTTDVIADRLRSNDDPVIGLAICLQSDRTAQSEFPRLPNLLSSIAKVR
jgi:hypothetical protein